MKSIENLNYQHKLFPYAYNILGSADDAFDVIQDVMMHYVAEVEKDIENENAYLIKSVINKSINLKNRSKRIGQPSGWLPEPISTDTADGNVKKKEIISYSMLVLLEHLNPKERAVFILKEAFDYSHEEIGATLGVTVENSRKLLSRAKAQLKLGNQDNQEFRPASTVDVHFLAEYVRHIQHGDVKSLEKLLSKEISFKADGGGRVKIVRELTSGVLSVMELMMYLYKTYQYQYTVKTYEVNHQPALLYYHNGRLVNCQVFELEKDESTIKHIFSVVDPQKLHHIGHA